MKIPNPRPVYSSTAMMLLLCLVSLLDTSCNKTFKARNIDDPYQEQGVDDYTEVKVPNDENLQAGDTARFDFSGSRVGGEWEYTADTSAERFVLLEEVSNE